MDKVWDTETQEVHGGQTWRQCPTFVSDFSVTTNAFGPPAAALAAAHAALDHIHHYPAADTADASAALAAFTDWPSSQLLLGNGASEFIDLIMRALPPGPFKPGPYPAAYMEYNRAAKAAGRAVLPPDTPPHNHANNHSDAAVTVLIHPNSPTGHCMSLDELRTLLVTTRGAVVVDESFMPFAGPDWRAQSALTLIRDFPDRLLVLASWTKLWACPGLRLGSIAASPEWTRVLKKLQTPWSCNSAAQAFTVAACADRDYMRRSWDTLPSWKARTEQHVRALRWAPNDQSPLWVPWVYVDCGEEAVAERACEVAHRAGCPVRHCASFGVPTCIRIGVRCPEEQDVLFEAWNSAFAEGGKGKVQ